MRIIRQRLLEMVHGLSVFLDVEDLEDISDLPKYIDASQVMLIFCSEGYFGSRNCMIELRSSVTKEKPIIALMEPEAKHGGLTRARIEEQLVEADQRYEKWGFDDDGPRSTTLMEALFATQPIEWNRIGAFQDVTLRLIAERLLPNGHQSTYLKGEAASYLPDKVEKISWKLPLDADKSFHIYCSPFNDGAAELIREVGQVMQMEVKMSATVDELPACAQILVYLNGRTWTSGSKSEAFAQEVKQAMAANVQVLLAHEMIGSGQEVRHGCEFGDFFQDPPDGTPRELLNANIYGKVAVALKAMPWREASMVLLARELCARDTHDSQVAAKSPDAAPSGKDAWADSMADAQPDRDPSLRSSQYISMPASVRRSFASSRNSLGISMQALNRAGTSHRKPSVAVVRLHPTTEHGVESGVDVWPHELTVTAREEGGGGGQPGPQRWLSMSWMSGNRSRNELLPEHTVERLGGNELAQLEQHDANEGAATGRDGRLSVSRRVSRV